MHDVKTDTNVALSSPWSGGGSPFAIGSKKLGMWLFIVSDTLTFSALLITYSYSRLTNPDWPRPFPINPAIIFSTTMTVVLLFSSLTMVMAVMAAQRNDRKKTVLWMMATMAGGLLVHRALHLTRVVSPDPRRAPHDHPEPLGNAAVWRRVFRDHRPAHDARDDRRHLPGDCCDRVWPRKVFG